MQYQAVIHEIIKYDPYTGLCLPAMLSVPIGDKESALSPNEGLIAYPNIDVMRVDPIDWLT